MKVEDLVPITLRCFKCLVERETLIPRERGVAPGKYLWECLECQWIFHGVKMYNLGDIAMYIEREGWCYYETGNVFRIAQ